MKTKLMTLQDATGFFRDGMTIMVGGFMGIGTPSRLVEALLESGVRDIMGYCITALLFSGVIFVIGLTLF